MAKQSISLHRRVRNRNGSGSQARSGTEFRLLRRRNSNDKNGTRSVLGNRLGHAAEEKLFQALSPVRSNDNTVGVPFRCYFENAHPRLAVDDTSADLFESGSAERLGGMKQQLFRSVAALLQGSVLFKKGWGFDYVNEENFTSLGAKLCCQDLRCRFGKLRTIDGQKYLHEWIPFRAQRSIARLRPARAGGIVWPQSPRCKRRMETVPAFPPGPVSAQAQFELKRFVSGSLFNLGYLFNDGGGQVVRVGGIQREDEITY
jgi:hypothetical protein